MVVELLRKGDELVTDVAAVRAAVERLGAGAVVAVVTTTSCFAPRACDDVVAVAQLCAESGVPHVINHAYGLQASKLCHNVNEACRLGRVDAWVASTDKNFLVPVGGAIVASPSPAVIDAVARSYPGRASMSPILDLFITLLQMGVGGLLGLLAERKAVADALRAGVAGLAARHGCRLLESRGNPISFAMSIDGITCDRGPDLCSVSVAHSAASAAVQPSFPPANNVVLTDAAAFGGAGREARVLRTEPSTSTSTVRAPALSERETYLGAMLFARGVSGTRVVAPSEVRKIDRWTFLGYGAQCNNYPCAYITAAAAIGMSRGSVATFCERLEATIVEYKRQMLRQVLLKPTSDIVPEKFGEGQGLPSSVA